MKYKIYRSSDSFALGQLVAETDDLNITLEDQPYGKYYYKFTETNNYGTSKPSAPVLVTCIAPANPPEVENGIGKITVTVPEIIGAATYRVEGRRSLTSEYEPLYEGTNRSFDITDEADIYPYMRAWATAGWDEGGAISIGNKSEDYEYTPPTITAPVLSIHTSGENLTFTYSGGEGALEVFLEDQNGISLATFDMASKSLTRGRPSVDTTYFAVAKAAFVTLKSTGVGYDYKTDVLNLKAVVNAITKAIDLTWEIPHGKNHDSFQIGHKLTSASDWTWINNVGKSALSYSIPLKANGTYDVKVNTVYGNSYKQGPEVKELSANLLSVGSAPIAVNAVGSVTINCTLPDGADAVHLEGSNDKNSWVKVHTGTSLVVTNQNNLYRYWRSYGTYNNVYIGEAGSVYEYLAPSIVTPVLNINTSAEKLVFTYTGGDRAIEMRLENAAGASLGKFDSITKSLTLARPNGDITYHAVGQAGFTVLKSAGVAYDYKVGARNLKATVNSTTKAIDLTWDAPYGSFHDSYQIGYKLSSSSSWILINSVGKSASSYSIPLKGNGTYDVKINTGYGSSYHQGMEVTGVTVNLLATGNTPTATNAVGSVTINCTLPNGADAVHLEGSNDKKSWVKVHTGTSLVVTNQNNLYRYWRSYGTYNNVYIGEAGSVYEYIAPSVAAVGLSISDPATGQLNFTYTGGGGALQIKLFDTNGIDYGAFSGTAKTISAPTTGTTFYAKGFAGLVTAQSANVAYNAFVPARNLKATFNNTTKKIDVSWTAPYNSTYTKFHVQYKENSDSVWTKVAEVPKGTTSYSITPPKSGTYSVSVYAHYGNITVESSKVQGISVILNINKTLSAVYTTTISLMGVPGEFGWPGETVTAYDRTAYTKVIFTQIPSDCLVRVTAGGATTNVIINTPYYNVTNIENQATFYEYIDHDLQEREGEIVTLSLSIAYTIEH